MRLFATLFILQVILSAKGFLYQSWKSPRGSFSSRDDGDPGSPLLLTPYIESGKIAEAKQLARVTLPGLPQVESYAGFFTVDKTYDSNLFVWYFPPPDWKDDIPKAENLTSAFATFVWLQGGPGDSSLYGLFEENGPIFVKNNTFQLREITWNFKYHLIYIDNPVGTGFSFTNDSRGYSKNQTLIGEHLYATLYQFYQMFPELLHLGLVVSGESYGGKYVPALAKTIHEKNPKAKAQGRLVLPLQGMVIGSGWCDPINQLNYADFLYELGLIDWTEEKNIEALVDKTRQLIKKKAWSNATHAYFELMGNLRYILSPVSLYNFMRLQQNDSLDDCSYCNLIKTVNVRKAIHVGNLTFDNTSSDVFINMNEDYMKSVAPWISELLENYKLLTYNGQQDISVAYPLTTNFLRHLNWSGSKEYEEAKRKKIIMKDIITKLTDISGYTKQTDNGRLMEALIRGAGHMASHDQPLWTTLFVFDWYEYSIGQGSKISDIYYKYQNIGYL